jgi:hypothetical protein
LISTLAVLKVIDRLLISTVAALNRKLLIQKAKLQGLKSELQAFCSEDGVLNTELQGLKSNSGVLNSAVLSLRSKD